MLIIAALDQLTQILEQAIARQILTIRVQEGLQVMTLTTDHQTQVRVIIAQEVQAQTMQPKVILTRVHLQVDHLATHTVHQAMIEDRQHILVRVEVQVLQVVLARVQVVLDLAQEEAVEDLVQVVHLEDQDNF